jgi:hypothetical protein
MSSGQMMGGSYRRAKYHLPMISIWLSLDRQNYSEGETAHLTINIHSPDLHPAPVCKGNS